MQIHENIAAYVRGWMSKKSRKRTEWDKLMLEKVRTYALDLDTESNAKFRRLNFRLIYSYAKIIEAYYSTLLNTNSHFIIQYFLTFSFTMGLFQSRTNKKWLMSYMER